MSASKTAFIGCIDDGHPTQENSAQIDGSIGNCDDASPFQDIYYYNDNGEYDDELSDYPDYSLDFAETRTPVTLSNLTIDESQTLPDYPSCYILDEAIDTNTPTASGMEFATPSMTKRPAPSCNMTVEVLDDHTFHQRRKKQKHWDGKIIITMGQGIVDQSLPPANELPAWMRIGFIGETPGQAHSRRHFERISQEAKQSMNQDESLSLSESGSTHRTPPVKTKKIRRYKYRSTRIPRGHSTWGDVPIPVRKLHKRCACSKYSSPICTNISCKKCCLHSIGDANYISCNFHNKFE